ncbi:MAG: hypothetical protein ACD_78C00127G0001 [uncultured bacterium (gcode 4)]|uniref:Uncharacterized protein n=1 Tax=uncultured bacterium (gcode 4) TaxID=1234023 RepID=K1XIQ0_9BACT|nr:MAG: hypothetical protein ACD_78C00127G0001 [uncultured bacterium (gcode 4)]
MYFCYNELAEYEFFIRFAPIKLHILAHTNLIDSPYLGEYFRVQFLEFDKCLDGIGIDIFVNLAKNDALARLISLPSRTMVFQKLHNE